MGQEIVNNSLEANQSSFFQLDLPQEGITISIDVMEGHVVLYASNKIQNPNEAFYDFKLEVDSTIGDLYMSSSDFLDPLTGLKKRQTTASSITVYFTIQGKKAINDFSMNTTMGDVTGSFNFVHYKTILYPLPMQFPPTVLAHLPIPLVSKTHSFSCTIIMFLPLATALPPVSDPKGTITSSRDFLYPVVSRLHLASLSTHVCISQFIIE